MTTTHKIESTQQNMDEQKQLSAMERQRHTDQKADAMAPK
jgi:hypothetical protein